MKKKIFYPIPNLCYCGCNEITWSGNKYINGHISKTIENRIKSRNRLLGKQTMGMTGKTPWNKGLIYKDDKRILCGENHVNVSGEKNPNYGNKFKHTQKTKDKISLSHIGMCGLSGINNPMYGRCGDKNPAWRGGTSFLPYCPKFNKQKKEEIRNQYGRKCYYCEKDEKDNITKSGKQLKLDVHHIDNDKEQGCNGKPWKLIPLCIKCHRKLNRKNTNHENIC